MKKLMKIFLGVGLLSALSAPLHAAPPSPKVVLPLAGMFLGYLIHQVPPQYVVGGIGAAGIVKWASYKTYQMRGFNLRHMDDPLDPMMGDLVRWNIGKNGLNAYKEGKLR